MFRLQARNLFLTYPKCPIPKEQALIYFQQKGLTYTKIIVAEETHADESKHLHMFVQLTKKCDIRNDTVLDMQHNGVVYHGNYQSAKNIQAVEHYVKKENSFIEDSKTESKMDIFEVFKQLDEREFLQYCITNRIQKGYHDEVIRIMSRCYDIEEEEIPNGTPLFNKIDSVSDYNHWTGKTFFNHLKSNPDPSSSLEQQEQEKPVGPENTYLSLPYSSPTWMYSDNLLQNINPSSLMTCPSSIYLEKDRSQSLIGNSLEQSISDILWPQYQPEWLRSSQETISPFVKMKQLNGE